MPTPKAKPYVLTLELADGTLTGKGKTVIEALSQIKPPFVKSRGLFTLTHEGKESKRIMYPMVIKHLLTHDIDQQVFQKNMMLMLK